MEEIKQYLMTCPTKEHWERVGIYHHHGFAIPLFSIHRKEGIGIGEYFDLLPLIDWCHSIGMDVIQLLPLNETSTDFSPYNAISSCALDPIYLSLSQLPQIEKYDDLLKEIDQLKQFNKEKRVPYKNIKKHKFAILRKYFLYVYEEFKKDQRYLKFLQQNDWLEEYALFRYLKNIHNHAPWNNWPGHLQNIDDKTFSILLNKFRDKLDFYYFIQFLCFSQMIKVKDYAEKKHVLLVGDIPILISPDSVDVWKYRKYFDMSHQAGAPPDSFNMKGQNWGFYLFQWKALKKDNYSWWKRRLNVATSCYHIYRIDHTVGFFRIWSILHGEEPLTGKFLPKDPKKWFVEGKEKLQMMIEASPMFPMAEDLGLIPKQVYLIEKELGILSTKLMRFETMENTFIDPKDYEPISVTTTGTHDAETLELWWQNNPKEIHRFCQQKNWTYGPSMTFEQRKEYLKDAHHSASLFHINPLQEYLALFPELVWENPSDERINVPGTVLPTNWTYRLKSDLATIFDHKELTREIIEILRE